MEIYLIDDIYITNEKNFVNKFRMVVIFFIIAL